MLFAVLLLRWVWPGSVLLVLRIFYGRLGLQGLYLTFLEECGPQLAAALKIVAEAEHSVAVNCMLGKDRTGTFSALVLMALGVPTERICWDYSLTAKFLTREYIGTMLARANLDTEELARCDKGVMAKTITQLVIKYGSEEKFLDHIGFDATWRTKLRQNFNKTRTGE